MTTAEALAPHPRRAPAARAGWLGLASLAAAALIVAPIVAVVGSGFGPGEGAWAHLVETVLGSYVWNTLLLLVGVTWGVVSIGVLSAWLAPRSRLSRPRGPGMGGVP